MEIGWRAMNREMRHIALLLALTGGLGGCGTIYVSPSVKATETAGLAVEVVALSPAAIAAANRAPYRPRELPAAFATLATAGPARGEGPLPELAVDAEIRPAAPVTSLPAPYVPGPYQIGIGDVLVLATRQETATTEELGGLLASQNRRQDYTVQDDGAISVADVGRIKVAGMTLAEAEAELYRALVGGGFQPSFSLEIAAFNAQKVAVGGAVGSGGLVPIGLQALSLGEALAASGGVSPGDAGEDYVTIRLYRDGSLYQVPLTEFRARPELQALALRDGDAVFVDTDYDLARAQAYFSERVRLAEFRQERRIEALKELESAVGLRRAELDEARRVFMARTELDAVARDYVYLTGEVGKPSRFPLPYGRQAMLADALFESGGVTGRTGNPSQIYVLRLVAGKANVTGYHLDARNAAALVLATRFELRPGDIIFVAEQPVTRWNRVVQQLVPSLLTTGISSALN